MDQAYIDQLRAILLYRDDYVDRIDPGLSDAAIETAQSQYGFTFPPDLRAVLQILLPMGPLWPNWRDPSNPYIQDRF